MSLLPMSFSPLSRIRVLVLGLAAWLGSAMMSAGQGIPTAAELSPEAEIEIPELPSRVEAVQIREVLTLSLEEALALAEANSLRLQLALTQIDSSRAALRAAQAEFNPTLNLQLSANRSISATGDVQTTISRQQLEQQLRNSEAAIPLLTAELSRLQALPLPTDPVELIQQQLQIFSVSQQLQQRLGEAESLPDSIGGTQNYGTLSLNALITINQTLYAGGRRDALVEAAESQLRVSELELQNALQQLRLEVIDAYYNLQEADQQVVIQEAAVREASRSLQDAEALLRASLATRLDVLNAQIQLENANLRLAQARGTQAIAPRALARLLNLPPDTSIRTSAEAEQAGKWELSLEESIVRALQNRPELEQQRLQRLISQAQGRAALANLLPQVSVSGNVNLVQLYTDDPRPASRVEGLGAGYSLQLDALWTFSDGGRTRAQVEQQQATANSSALQVADLAAQIRLEVEQAFVELDVNERNIATASLTLEQTQEALRIARLRFQAGLGTQLDVLNAESRLTEANSSLVQAILGYNRALARIQRATSTLSGELEDTPAPTP
ncbi:TolC family protein [Synechococcus sp. Nb3U1]|uniref:TolC family protein n=1 Tax=Synechococcus sp. Nb3U1 TaxID=1914529 RepID=UPI001F42A7FD|nr:TolC family protein [Synechococcus sp. Nb3U1]MCF2972525.1 TolC family protein [Synechococcus sp. Nb3U1]